MPVLKYYGPLCDLTGCKSDYTAATSLQEARNFIRQKYGEETLRMARGCTVIVNDKNYNHLRQKKPRFKDEDTIHFFPPLAGG